MLGHARWCPGVLLLLSVACHLLPLHDGAGLSDASSSSSSSPKPQTSQDSVGQPQSLSPSAGGLPGSHDDDSAQPWTRLSFGELHQPSSSSYSSRCCDIVPELCTSSGRCALNVTDCVSFCICARSPELPWCAGELRRLQDVLHNQQEQAKPDEHAAGGTEGGPRLTGSSGGGADADSDVPGASSSGSSLDSHGKPPELGMTMDKPSASGHGPAGTLGEGLGSLYPEGEGAGPSEDNFMSPAQLASSLNEAAGPHESRSKGAGGDLSGDPGASGTSHEQVSQAPPLAAMMDGEITANTTGDELVLGVSEEGQNTSKPLNKANLTGVSTNSLDNNNTNNTDTIASQDDNNNNNLLLLPSRKSGSNFSNTVADVPSPWWPDYGDDACGPECMLSGGRCVFDFNQTYTQVCVYDSVQPCQKFKCHHGTCVSRNGSYSCECEEGWAGVFCSKRCELDCGEHGRCVITAGDAACRCHSNYTGVRCDELIPTPLPGTGEMLYGTVARYGQVERRGGGGLGGGGWGGGGAGYAGTQIHTFVRTYLKSYMCARERERERGGGGERERREGGREREREFVCLLVACLTSQQQASVSQGRICLDNFTCCHTEIEVADQRSTSPSHSILTPGRPVPVLTL